MALLLCNWQPTVEKRKFQSNPKFAFAYIASGTILFPGIYTQYLQNSIYKTRYEALDTK
jgi:hypothetical protein